MDCSRQFLRAQRPYNKGLSKSSCKDTFSCSRGVQNDLLMQADAGEFSVVVLLDLSAVFDTVDHHILIGRLRQWVGISQSALECTIYLSNKTFLVTAENHAALVLCFVVFLKVLS